jgi:hypothetical protein
VVGIPSNLSALAREEMTAEMPAVLPVPLLLLQEVEIKPAGVAPGSRFDLVVRYFISDSSTKQEQIPVQINFTILQGSQVFYSPKGIEVKSKNGGSTV